MKNILIVNLREEQVEIRFMTDFILSRLYDFIHTESHLTVDFNQLIILKENKILVISMSKTTGVISKILVCSQLM